MRSGSGFWLRREPRGKAPNWRLLGALRPSRALANKQCHTFLTAHGTQCDTGLHMSPKEHFKARCQRSASTQYPVVMLLLAEWLQEQGRWHQSLDQLAEIKDPGTQDLEWRAVVLKALARVNLGASLSEETPSPNSIAGNPFRESERRFHQSGICSCPC